MSEHSNYCDAPVGSCLENKRIAQLEAERDHLKGENEKLESDKETYEVYAENFGDLSCCYDAEDVTNVIERAFEKLKSSRDYWKQSHSNAEGAYRNAIAERDALAAENAAYREALELCGHNPLKPKGTWPTSEEIYNDRAKRIETAQKALSTPASNTVERMRAAEDVHKQMYDALLNADRYFKAKDGVYACDVRLCEKTAKYAVDKAIEAYDKLKQPAQAGEEG